MNKSVYLYELDSVRNSKEKKRFNMHRNGCSGKLY